MQKPKKKGVIVVSILAYSFLAIYVALFVLVGVFKKVPDGSAHGFLQDGVGSFVTGHLDQIPNILNLSLPAGAWMTWVLLGVFVLILGAMVLSYYKGIKYKAFVTGNGMIGIYLALIPLILTACGFHVYLDVWKKVAPYDDGALFALITVMVVCGVAYIGLAIALTFVCVNAAQNNPGKEYFQEEAKKQEIFNAVVEEEFYNEEIDFEDMNREDLMAMIKQAVREVLAEEVGQAEVKKEGDANVITGPFGMPVVVQYFGGKKPEAEPAPAPVVAPVVAPVEEEAEAEKVVRERVPFDVRMSKMDKNMQEAYNELKNEIMSYGMKSRISAAADTFRLHRKTYIKLVVAGKGLKLFLALDPKEYVDSPIPVTDVSEKNAYVDIPLAFKVKSDLSRKRAKQLIADCMKKDGIEQGEVENVNYVKQIRADIRARKEAEKEEN